MIEYFFMDVGQGDFTLIIDDLGCVVLIDGGSSKNAATAGKLALESACGLIEEAFTEKKKNLLKFKEVVDDNNRYTYMYDKFCVLNGRDFKDLAGNICHIDLLILTHKDADHVNLIRNFLTVNGFYVMAIAFGGDDHDYGGELNAIKQRKISEKRNPYQIKVANPLNDAFSDDCQRYPGDWRNLLFEMLEGSLVLVMSVNLGSSRSTPFVGVTADANNDSLCVAVETQLTTGGVARVLFMGDAGAGVEATIIAKAGKSNGDHLLRATAIKLGHHGSKHSTSTEWCQATSPKAAFCTADFRYSHPNVEVVERLYKHSPRLLDLPVYQIGSGGPSQPFPFPWEHPLILAENYEYHQISTNRAIFTNLVFHAHFPNEIPKMKSLDYLDDGRIKDHITFEKMMDDFLDKFNKSTSNSSHAEEKHTINRTLSAIKKFSDFYGTTVGSMNSMVVMPELGKVYVNTFFPSDVDDSKTGADNVLRQSHLFVADAGNDDAKVVPITVLGRPLRTGVSYLQKSGDAMDSGRSEWISQDAAFHECWDQWKKKRAEQVAEQNQNRDQRARLRAGGSPFDNSLNQLSLSGLERENRLALNPMKGVDVGKINRDLNEISQQRQAEQQSKDEQNIWKVIWDARTEEMCQKRLESKLHHLKKISNFKICGGPVLWPPPRCAEDFLGNPLEPCRE